MPETTEASFMMALNNFQLKVLDVFQRIQNDFSEARAEVVKLRGLIRELEGRLDREVQKEYQKQIDKILNSFDKLQGEFEHFKSGSPTINESKKNIINKDTIAIILMAVIAIALIVSWDQSKGGDLIGVVKEQVK